MNRRIMMSTAGAALAAPFLTKLSAQSTRLTSRSATAPGPVRSMPGPIATNVHLALATAFNHAKAHTLTDAHLARMVGALSVAFPLWDDNGTTARVQRQYTPAFIASFQPTQTVRLKLVEVSRGAGADIEESDFSFADYVEDYRSSLSPNVGAIMAKVVIHSQLHLPNAAAAIDYHDFHVLGIGNAAHILRTASTHSGTCGRPGSQTEFENIALASLFVAAAGWEVPFWAPAFGIVSATYFLLAKLCGGE